MKRSYLDYREWVCIREKTRAGQAVRMENFRGYVGLMHILAVEEVQTWHFNGESMVVCDAGMQWLTMLPENGEYCITAMLDSNARPLVWYIDMIDAQGIDENGVPWFDDLYLDLVVYPGGTVLTDDRDELDAALQSGEITPGQHAKALAVERMLREGLLASVEELAEITERCRKAVLQA